MSRDTLLCPACGTPAPPRVDLPQRYSYVERYTCHACGLMTLREELVTDKRFTVGLGGGATPAPPSALPETISAAVNETLSPAVATTDYFSALPLSNLVASPTSITSVTFSASVSWSRAERGPADALWYFRWREGAGTWTDYGPVTPAEGAAYSTISSAAIATNFASAPWSIADVNSLEMQAYCTTDDLGSQSVTDIGVATYSALIAGTP